MTSADEQLCLNITGGGSPDRRKNRNRWSGTMAEKRRFGGDPEISSAKRRRPREAVREAVRDARPSVPHPRQEDSEAALLQTPPKKKDGRSSIKTSSLFRNNPDIPDIHRPDVLQMKEKIFTSDSFSDLHLHPHLVATLSKVLNVSTLTSVQKQTIPALLSGRDAVVRSQTGSGKTLSFAVPVVQSLQAVRPKVQRSDGPLAVVMVPTRELALQTYLTFQKLLKPFTWIVPGVLMGGEKRKAEKARLRKGINILVSTPGRLVDHIKHTLSIAFSATRWLVLDEADRTLDLGFEKDLTIILNSLNSSGSSRQNVLLSATLTSGVTRLADICLKEPVSIQVCESAPCDLSADTVTSDPEAAAPAESFTVPEELSQFVVLVPSKVRLVCLAAFILDKCQFSEDNKLVVFVSSCEVVEFLHHLLTSVLCRPSATHKTRINFLRLHGNMKQEERSEVFLQFSASLSGVLLCTDVAARGLDLPQVTWIVQYTPPAAATEYVHRVGRTARIGGRGSSLLFLTPSETAFIDELANHNISLSEMKLLDILSTLMKDDTYKGRGKYHSKSSARAREQEVMERSTVLQTEFENFVHSDAQSVQTAKKALQSFLRAYTAYPAPLKHIFHIRSLHLGHAAKSFGLRDAPQGLAAARGAPSRDPSRKRDPKKQAGGQKRSIGRRERHLLQSEFSSGMEGTLARKKRLKKQKKGSE